jgi:hypothetical protein
MKQMEGKFLFNTAKPNTLTCMVDLQKDTPIFLYILHKKPTRKKYLKPSDG